MNLEPLLQIQNVLINKFGDNISIPYLEENNELALDIHYLIKHNNIGVNVLMNNKQDSIMVQVYSSNDYDKEVFTTLYKLDNTTIFDITNSIVMLFMYLFSINNISNNWIELS